MSRSPLPALFVMSVMTGAGIALWRSAPLVNAATLPANTDVLLPWLAWWVALGIFAWFLMSFVGWLTALRSGDLARITSLERITIPGSRKLAEAMLSVGLVTIPAACSLPSAESSPRMEIIHDLAIGAEVPRAETAIPDSPATEAPATEAPATAAPTTEAPATEAPVEAPLADALREYNDAMAALAEPPSVAPTQAATATEHTVERGDHLWGIAKDTLATRLERQPTNSETASYWRQLIQDNRDHLASGDPNLIYPGEVLRLPA